MYCKIGDGTEAYNILQNVEAWGDGHPARRPSCRVLLVSSAPSPTSVESIARQCPSFGRTIAATLPRHRPRGADETKDDGGLIAVKLPRLQKELVAMFKESHKLEKEIVGQNW